MRHVRSRVGAVVARRLGISDSRLLDIIDIRTYAASEVRLVPRTEAAASRSFHA
jgi:hypothetical protein